MFSAPKGQLLYREVQYFAPWAYVVGAACAVVCFISLAVRPPQLSHSGVVIVGVVMGACLLVTLWMRLEIEVRDHGVYVRLVPFPWIKINLTDYVGHEVVTYHPIREYGGWGIRLTLGGRAYNARGNRGVRITYANGRHVLLGSQQPEQLANAISVLLGYRSA